jgi:putative glycosyltransferase (TIGR04372 family)
MKYFSIGGIVHMKDSGWNMIIQKIKTILAIVPTGLFVITVIILRSFYLIRWKNLVSARLGHFAANVELYCCERDHGINVPNKPHIDLFYLDRFVCNEQLANMWRREINIAPKFTFVIFNLATRIINFLSTRFPTLKSHLIGSNVCHDRDTYNLLEKTKQHLLFTKDEKVKGKRWLSDHNIPPDAKIILLAVRDNEYLDKTQKNHNWKYHNYRDCNIDNFIFVAEALANRGFYVIRIGHHKKKLKSNHSQVVDYATNGMRSDFMDIYLASICYFIISTAHGADAPASWCFRKPRVILNQCPTGYLQTWNSADLLLTKRHVLQEKNRELTLSDIFSKGVGFCLGTQCYRDKNILLEENTSKEIHDITMEMVDRLEGNYQPRFDDEFLQSRFWGIFLTNAVSPNGKLLHGKIKSRFGAAFLRNNPNWLK